MPDKEIKSKCTLTSDFVTKDLLHDNESKTSRILRRTKHEEVRIDLQEKVAIYPTYHKIENGLMEWGFRFNDDMSDGTFNEIYIEGAHIFFNDLSAYKTRIINAEITQPVMQMYFLLAGDNSVTYKENKYLGTISQNQHNLFFRPFLRESITSKESDLRISGYNYQKSFLKD
jgi:hypothetical protein